MKNIKIQGLYNKLKDLTKNVIKNIPESSVQRVSLMIPFFNTDDDERNVKLHQIFVPHPNTLYTIISIFISKYKQVTALIDEINHNEILNNLFLVKNTDNQIDENEKDFGVVNIVSNFVYDCYEDMIRLEHLKNPKAEAYESTGPIWNIKKFNKLYNNFESSIFDKKITIHLWVPLYNIEVNSKSSIIKIDKHCSLLEPDMVQKINIHSNLNYKNYIMPNNLAILRERYYLKYILKVDFGNNIEFDTQKLLDLYIFAIQLGCGGQCKYNKVIIAYTKGEPRKYFIKVPAVFNNKLDYYNIDNEKSMISKKNANKIKKYKKGLDELYNEYSIPIERYLSAIYRGELNDKLIDAVIALESLLLPNIKDELKYRFSLRGGWILGKNQKDKIELFSFFKKIYDLRSDIVHGNKKSNSIKETEVGEAINKIHYIFKKILNKSYNYESWKKFIEKLECNLGN